MSSEIYGSGAHLFFSLMLATLLIAILITKVISKYQEAKNKGNGAWNSKK